MSLLGVVPQLNGIAGPGGASAGTFKTTVPNLFWQAQAVPGSYFPSPTSFRIIFQDPAGNQSLFSNQILFLNGLGNYDSPQLYFEFTSPVSYPDGTVAIIQFSNSFTNNTLQSLKSYSLETPIQTILFDAIFLFSVSSPPQNGPNLLGVAGPGFVQGTVSLSKNYSLTFNNDFIPMLKTNFALAFSTYGNLSPLSSVISIQNGENNAPELYFEFPSPLQSSDATVLVLLYCDECTGSCTSLSGWQILQTYPLDNEINHIFYSSKQVFGACIESINPANLSGIQSPVNSVGVVSNVPPQPLMWTGVGGMIQTEFRLILQEVNYATDPPSVKSSGPSNFTITTPYNSSQNSPMLYFEFAPDYQPPSNIYQNGILTTRFLAVVQYQNECTKGKWVDAEYYDLDSIENEGILYSNPTLQEYVQKITSQQPVSFSPCAIPPQAPVLSAIIGPGVTVGSPTAFFNPQFGKSGPMVETQFSLIFFHPGHGLSSPISNLTITIPASSNNTCPELYFEFASPVFTNDGTMARVQFKLSCLDTWLPAGDFVLFTGKNEDQPINYIHFQLKFDYNCITCACNDGQVPSQYAYCVISDKETNESLNALYYGDKNFGAQCDKNYADYKIVRKNINGNYVWLYPVNNIAAVNSYKVNNCYTASGACCNNNCKAREFFLNIANDIQLFGGMILDALFMAMNIALGAGPIGIALDVLFLVVDAVINIVMAEV